MRRTALAAWLVAMGLTLAACGEIGSAGSSVSQVDSAGVQIVTNASGRHDIPTWRLEQPPLAHIGSQPDDSTYRLGRVEGAFRLSDGRILIANGATNELRYYDSEGRYLNSVGGTGRDPGQFMGLTRIALALGDSVFAWDSRLGRLTVFDSAGAFVRAFTFKRQSKTGRPAFAGRFSDGTLLVTDRLLMDPRQMKDGTMLEGATAFLHYAPDGTLINQLGRFPWRPSYIQVSQQRAVTVYPVPFETGTLFQVHGDRLYLASGTAFQMRIYSPDGTLRRIVRREHLRPLLSRGMVETQVRRILQRVGDEEARKRAAQAYATMAYPKRVPALEGLRIAEDGSLWIKGFPLPGESGVRWSVFDRDGVLTATVQLVETLFPLQIGEDWLLALRLDNEGRENVDVYRLAEQGAG